MNNSFPIQKLPISQKTNEWKEACVKYIVDRADANMYGEERVSRTDMKAYYDLYNSIYDERRLKYVTNPFKQEDGFPATAQNINIIKPQIDLLLGEETKRPFNFRVIRTSDVVTTELQDKMQKMLTDYMMMAIYANMSEEDALVYQEQLETGEIQPPEEIVKYYRNSYKDVGESIAYHSMRYLRLKLNLDSELLDGLKDALISSEEIYYIGSRNGSPYAERVNPMYFSYEYSPDLKFIHEASWCARKMQMSPQELYDNHYNEIDSDMLDKILLKFESNGMFTNSGTIKTRFTEISNGNSPKYDLITLWHTNWQSYKKIGWVVLEDPETGEIDEHQVDESYYVTGEEISVTWDWALEAWEGYYIDDDLMFGIKPSEYQYVSIDNPNSQRLSYTGTVYSNTNSKPKSVVSFLEPLEYYHIMLWYRLELALARDKGKVLTMDITQIPTNFGIDVPKWMHMLSALGVNIINPYDEGWNVPGREGGKPSSFNQISSEDLSMSQTIGQYIDLITKVEEMAGSITGITKQRLGAISSNELVGNVERSMTQSSHITEPIYYKHNLVKKEVITMILELAKYLWKTNDKNDIHYVLPDGERIFLTLSDDFLNSDFDIFVSDSSEENSKIQQLHTLFQPAMQNGASLSDIAEIMTLDNISKIKEKLNEIEENRRVREEEIMKQEQENQRQIAEINAQIEQAKLEDKQADRELEKYKIDSDNQTKIIVANIGTYRFQQELDQDGDGIPDPTQIMEYGLKQQDLDEKKFKAREEVKLKQKDIETKRAIEKDRVQLEKEKMNNQLALQKQKDDAAKERELIKSRTALKNKVVGEK